MKLSNKSGWSKRRLKYLSTIDNSGSYGDEPGARTVEAPVATTAQIKPDGTLLVEDMPVRSFSRTEYNRFACQPGDIVVVKSSGSATNVITGKLAVTDENTAGFVFSNFLLRIKPNKKQIDPRFLGYFLQSSFVREQINLMVSTTTYPNLKVAEYTGFEIPLPLLREQCLIADFLDRETAKADAVVAKYERLIELLEEKRTALITQAVTKGLDPSVPMKDSGIEWLGEVPTHWRIYRLSKVAREIKTGPFGSVLHADDYTANGVPVINPAHLINGEIRPDERISVDKETCERLQQYRLKPGDIVMGRRGEMGRTAVVTSVENGWLCGTGSMKVTPDDNICSAQLLALILSSHRAKHWFSFQSQGATMDNLSPGLISRFRLALPPRDQQDTILARLNVLLARVDALMNKCNSAIRLVKEHRSSLITAAVTGQIDVRTYRSQESRELEGAIV